MKIHNNNSEDGPILLDAMIKYEGINYQPQEVGDFSMQGVLILSRDGILTKLKKDTPVELALKLQTYGKTKTHIFHAEVSQNSHKGTRLTFCDADIDAYSALLHLTYRDQ